MLRTALEGNDSPYIALESGIFIPLFNYIRGYFLDNELSKRIYLDVIKSSAKELLAKSRISNIKVWLFEFARTAIIHELKENPNRTNMINEQLSNRNIRNPFKSTNIYTAKELIQNLALGDRELIILKYWNGFTNPEMARITGKTRESVRKQLNTIMRNIKDVYSNLFIEKLEIVLKEIPFIHNTGVLECIHNSLEIFGKECNIQNTRRN